MLAFTFLLTWIKFKFDYNIKLLCLLFICWALVLTPVALALVLTLIYMALALGALALTPSLLYLTSYFVCYVRSPKFVSLPSNGNLLSTNACKCG